MQQTRAIAVDDVAVGPIFGNEVVSYIEPVLEDRPEQNVVLLLSLFFGSFVLDELSNGHDFVSNVFFYSDH